MREPGSAPLPGDAVTALDLVLVLDAGAEALGQTVEVAIEGYRGGSSWGERAPQPARRVHADLGDRPGSTHVIRHRGPTGPFRNVVLGGGHIHHFVPGIGLAFVSGGVAVVPPRGAAPVAGAALRRRRGAHRRRVRAAAQARRRLLDEEGIVSVQLGFASLAALSAVAPRCASCAAASASWKVP